ncbi:MAG TPA: hypothetical protein VEH49_10415, partial [Methylomirabilota bacterium]|nr:hypothetical protein [Methylomirabilota bacterium]
MDLAASFSASSPACPERSERGPASAAGTIAVTSKSFEIRTSAISPSNPFRIRTSEIIGLKVLQNEHFR